MLLEKAEILDERAISRAVTRITHEILERNKGIDRLCIVGIKCRGAHLAQRIANKIQEVEGRTVPVGLLDITPYRDDIEPGQAVADTSELPFAMENARVVLVDDVLYTGRTVRAAINSVMARGRPENIQLAALIDRGHRELPIRPDYVGKNLPTSRDEMVWVQMREADGVDRVVIAVDDSNGKDGNANGTASD